MTDTDAPSESTAASRPTLAHIPVLDGLRAVAVVAVVLFHTWEGVFTGGFIGVDVFFVISGFLITSLLVGEHRGSGRIDLPAFWGRRIRRLAPAVVVLVIVTSIVVHLIGEGSALGLADAIGALTWTQNWVHLAVSSSTWALHDNFTVLDHLWSLAIEEQFYLVWPLLLLGLLRVTGRKATRLGVVVVMIVASATVMGLVGDTAAYFRTDARAFELLGGALLALSGWRPGPRTAHVLGSVGLVAIVVFTFTGSPADHWLYPWGFLLATALFAGLIASSVNPPGWMAALLTGPAAAVGRVSYGIYLWHVPVIRILTPGRVGWNGVPLAVLRLVVLTALVLGSYRFVEQPVRSRRWRLTPARVVGVGAVTIVSLIPLASDARDDLHHQWDATGMPAVAAGADRVLVVGDGMAALVARGFPPSTTWDTSLLGCGLVPGAMRQGSQVLTPDVSCSHWATRWADAVAAFHPTTVVVMESTWDLIDRVDGRSPAELAPAAYQRAVSILSRGGARVVWIEPIDPSGVSPVPRPDRAGRVATADRLATVIRGLGVDAVTLGTGQNPVGPMKADMVTAAGAELSAQLRG